jgi:nitrogen-specific signal transduction histidine kinase
VRPASEIVQRVAADHGGRIRHEQRPGATVFRLELPIAGGIAG